MVRIQHAPDFALGNVEIAGETALRHTGLAERFVEGRLQRNRHRRHDEGPALGGARRLGQALSLKCVVSTTSVSPSQRPLDSPVHDSDVGARAASRGTMRASWTISVEHDDLVGRLEQLHVLVVEAGVIGGPVLNPRMQRSNALRSV